jgi:hypothetical protein
MFPPSLEKKLSEAKSSNKSIIESLKEFKGKERAVTTSTHLPPEGSFPVTQ